MRTLALKPTHKRIAAYHASLADFAKLGVKHETAVRAAFQALLEESPCERSRGDGVEGGAIHGCSKSGANGAAADHGLEKAAAVNSGNHRLLDTAELARRQE